MSVSPSLRRALHQCIDILCDALAEEARGQPLKKVKKRRGPCAETLEPLDPAELPPHLREQLEQQMKKNGYRKA